MATNADALAQGADTDPNAPDPNAQPPGEGGEPEGGEGAADDTPEPLKELAREMGWTPREEYSGPPEAYKDARQFIRDGRDIQRETSRELKSLRQTVETIGRTSAAIVEQTVEQRVNALGQQYQQAVDDGDANKAFKLSAEIQRTLADKPAAPSGPSPAAQSFAEKNGSWFQKDPLATALAIEVTNRLASQGYPEQAQLDAAEREVRRVYPHVISGQRNGTKPQAGVNTPGGRAPHNNGGRAKGFGDMPPEARRIAEDMAAKPQLSLGDPDAFRKRYAENYWREAERKS